MVRRIVVLSAVALAVAAACTPTPTPTPPTPGRVNGMLVVAEITSPPGPFRAGFMQPGSIRGVENVYLVRPDGTSLRKIYTSNGLQLTFSPGGPKVVFAKGWPASIWVMNADGSGLKDILPDCLCENPSLSPDGSRIAYVLGSSVFVMNADGTDRARLTSCSYVAYPSPADRMHCAWVAGGPTWSPDGSKIAYAQAVFSGDKSLYGAPGLWVMDANGSDRQGVTACTRRICPNGWVEPRAGVNDPAWSPLGDSIAYLSRDSLMQISPAGSNISVVSSSLCGHWNPQRLGPCVMTPLVWSPDGRSIALTTRQGSGVVTLMSADGTGAHVLPLPTAPRSSWQVVAWLPATT
jgi:Tol biopolymer transport system component